MNVVVNVRDVTGQYNRAYQKNSHRDDACVKIARKFQITFTWTKCLLNCYIISSSQLTWTTELTEPCQLHRIAYQCLDTNSNAYTAKK